jgi:hypothetical protein
MLLAYIYRSITYRVHFLDKASRDLLICAKDLLAEAIQASKPWPSTGSATTTKSQSSSSL